MLQRAGIMVPDIKYILTVLCAMVPMSLLNGLYSTALFLNGIGKTPFHFIINNKMTIFSVSGFAIIAVIKIINRKMTTSDHTAIAVLITGAVSLIPVLTAVLLWIGKDKSFLENI